MEVLEIFKRPKAFLFADKGSVAQLAVKNTFWLTLAELLNQGLKLVLVIIATRVLGAAEYGIFTFALAFAGLFLFIADFGLNNIVTREFARKEQKREVFWSLVLLKLFLAGVALLGIFLLSFLVSKSPQALKVIWLLGLMVVVHGIGELFFAYFRAKQQMEKEAVVRISEAVVVAALGFWVLFSSPSAFNLSLAYLAAAIFSVSALAIFFNFRVFRLGLRLDLSLFKKFLLLSWPLAFTEIFAVIYNQIDSVMMGAWGLITEVGWYNAAYKVALGAILPVMLLSRVFFTPLAWAFENSKEKFQKIWDYFFQAVFMVAVPLAVGGIILAPKIISFLYGQDFGPASQALQILMLMTLLFYLAYAFNRLLIVADKQLNIFWISFAGAILNIVLNFILIPPYSLYGAAIATVITFTAIFTLFSLVIWRQVGLQIFTASTLRMFLVSLLAVLVMAVFLLLGPTQNWHVLLTVAAGAFVYGLALFLWHRLILGRS